MTSVVWLKRDLRLEDHAPLVEAVREGPIVGLYVFEPSILAEPDVDACHVDFVLRALEALRARWTARGGTLLVRVGELPEVLERLRAELPFHALWSHQETGNRATFARDRAVARWCRGHGVTWTERPQHGVFRPHPARSGWARRWEERMRPAPQPAPERLSSPPNPPEPGALPTLAELRFGPSPRVGQELATREAAVGTLSSFLGSRGRTYRFEMSSPVTAPRASSRLSPALAYGTLGLREVHHALERRRAELAPAVRRRDREAVDWSRSLESFAGRLRWHCHFIQKLEDEPALEHQNLHRGYDGLRCQDPADWTDAERRRFEAFRSGRTGFPLVDAVMRALAETGWINFRMRAMVMSFASYHLWLHWRPTGLELARRFVDYEPGIHWSQCQMQAGTTGINTVRIYSPAKQVTDHDPRGVFIRRWVPELTRVPDTHLAAPHTLSLRALAQTGAGEYPRPVVDAAEAVRHARAELARLRAQPDVKQQAREVHARHGSRKRPARREPRDSGQAREAPQLTWLFDD